MTAPVLGSNFRQMLGSYWAVPEIRGLGSLGFLRYSSKALALGRLILITRWLTPGDMGAFGLAVLILAVTEVVTETGVNVALLKQPGRLARYIHTAWAVSIVRGILIASVMILAAPWLQSFFGVSDLPMLLLWCAAIAAVKGFINPAVISFHQNLEFGKETLYRVPLQLIDIFSGLLLSWWWVSATGLLAGLFIASLFEVGSSFIVFSERPHLSKANWQAFRDLYRETRLIIVNGIVSYLNEHADDIVIGRLLGPVALGLYQTGYKLVSAVTLDVANISGAALYPILATRFGKPKLFRQTFLRAYVGVTILLLSMAVIFVGLPNYFVEFLFDEQWQPVALLLPWLFVAASAKALMLMCNPVAILTHTLRWHLLGNLVIVGLMVTGIYAVGPQYGIVGATIAVAAAMISVQPIIGFVTWRSLRKA